MKALSHFYSRCILFLNLASLSSLSEAFGDLVGMAKWPYDTPPVNGEVVKKNYQRITCNEYASPPTIILQTLSNGSVPRRIENSLIASQTTTDKDSNELESV